MSPTPLMFPRGLWEGCGCPRRVSDEVTEFVMVFLSLCPAVHGEGPGGGEMVPEVGGSAPGEADGEPRGLRAPAAAAIPAPSSSFWLSERLG